MACDFFVGSAIVFLKLRFQSDAVLVGNGFHGGIEKWRNSVDGKLVQLNCGHYVHDFEYVKIAEGIRELAKRL